MIRLDRIHAFFLAAASSALVAVAAMPAQAVVVDPVGDFLTVYTGPPNGDLDVTAVDAVLSGAGAVELVGTHAAPIGTTSGAAYVWGIDRGAGTELLTLLDPPAGEGVTFDSVVALFPDGSGFFLDLIAGGAPQFLDPAAIDIAGSTIRVGLSEALMPSQGLAFADYRYNLWPRFAPGGVDPNDNTQISDFAPDASTFTARQVRQVPEPPVLWLLAGGVVAVIGLRYRRRRAG